MKSIYYQKWLHTVKLEMYVGVKGCCTFKVIMLTLNAFNMQNADEHFPVEGSENAFMSLFSQKHLEKQ